VTRAGASGGPPRRRPAGPSGVAARRAAALLGALSLAACSGEPPLPPAAERGRQVYLGQCTACHAQDPARDGPVGPAVRGASAALLEAKVLRGVYPPGHAPQRSTAIMAPMPGLAGSLEDLAAYLR
jgi:mono/diheme cytochrome c family protein